MISLSFALKFAGGRSPINPGAAYFVMAVGLREESKMKMFMVPTSGLSRLPSITNTRPGKLSKLLVNNLEPQSEQKLRSSPLPDSAI